MTPDERAALRKDVENAYDGGGLVALMPSFSAHTVGRLLDALDAETARADAAEALASRNWKSWEREATEHARTLGLIGAPKTGEPLSEGEQQRFEAAVERGLRRRAEDERDEARAALDRVLALAPITWTVAGIPGDWLRADQVLRAIDEGAS